MGAKLYWAKEITTYGKTIIITMYDWVCNINKCNCITIMPQKGKTKKTTPWQITIKFLNTSDIETRLEEKRCATYTLRNNGKDDSRFLA